MQPRPLRLRNTHDPSTTRVRVCRPPGNSRSSTHSPVHHWSRETPVKASRSAACASTRATLSPSMSGAPQRVGNARLRERITAPSYAIVPSGAMTSEPSTFRTAWWQRLLREEASYELTRFVLLRLLAFVYLVAFIALARQVE